MNGGSPVRIRVRLLRTKNTFFKCRYEDAPLANESRWITVTRSDMEVCTGAGIVAFSFDDSGEPVVLMGREKVTPGWKQGSNKWGAFSGRSDQDEIIEETAAREFIEESIAVVPIDETSPVPVSRVQVEQCLRDGDYVRKIEHISQTKDGTLRKHVLYLKWIPYGDHALTFNHFRNSLGRLDDILRRYNRLRNNVTCPKICQVGYFMSATVVVVDVVHRDDSFEIHVDDNGISHFVHISGLTSQEDMDTKKLIRCWRDIKNVIERGLSDDILEHPALSLKLSGGKLVGAKVHKPFLEKNQIGWWSMKSLQNAMATNDEAIRRPFHDVVPAIVDGILASSNLLVK